MVEPVIDDSLVLWLNGACGKNSPATRRWVDLSGKGNHGELQNFGFGEGSGWTGEGLEFDGVDDYVYLGNKESIANIGVDGLTVTVVFAVSDIEKQSIVCRVNPRGQDWQYQIRKETSIIEFRVWRDGLYGSSFPIVTYKPGVMSVAVTYDGINIKLYADGALVRTIEYLSGIVTGQPTYIGRYWDKDTRYLDGEIYSALFYNRALSPEEVLQNHQAGYTWTPQIGHRTVTSVVKPITASASRAGRGRRDVISTVKPITGSAERKGVGRRDVVSTVKPITAKATRKGVGKREVVSTVKPIVSTVNLKLPPIKAVLSLEERVPSLGITERKPKIEIK